MNDPFYSTPNLSLIHIFVELGNVEIESMFNEKMAERTGLWQSR